MKQNSQNLASTVLAAVASLYIAGCATTGPQSTNNSGSLQSGINVTNLNRLEADALRAFSTSYSSNVLEQVNQFNASGNFAAIITGDDGNGYLTMKNGTNAVLIGGVKTNGVYNGIGADMSQDVNGTTVYTVSGTNALGGKVNLSLTNVLSSSAPLYKMLVPLVQTNTSSPAASVPVAKTPAATGANATYTPRP